MTKTVRIENADNSPYEVEVEVWDNTAQGPVLVETLHLKYPTTMVSPYITSTRYLVVKEKVST